MTLKGQYQRPLIFQRLRSRKAAELDHMLLLHASRKSYMVSATPSSDLALSDLERSNLRCRKWSKFDTCMVRYCVRVNPWFILQQWVFDTSLPTQRSMDLLFLSPAPPPRLLSPLLHRGIDYDVAIVTWPNDVFFESGKARDIWITMYLKYNQNYLKTDSVASKSSKCFGKRNFVSENCCIFMKPHRQRVALLFQG